MVVATRILAIGRGYGSSPPYREEELVPDTPIAIVSSDCHIGPRLVEDLRPHCPADLLARFDAYVADGERSSGRYVQQTGADDEPLSPWRNRWAEGHHDPSARRRDLAAEGIVAEVIFHGSQNDQPLPQASASTTPGSPSSARMRRTGTSATPTCRCGTSTPRWPSSGGRRPTACGA